MDAFQESKYLDFVENELFERDAAPNCAAVGVTSGIITWPNASGRPGWLSNTYPYGNWRIRLDLTITAASTYPESLPEFWRTIHLIICRCQEGQVNPIHVIYPTPENDAPIGSATLALFSTGSYLRVPEDFPKTGDLQDTSFPYFAPPVIVPNLNPLAVWASASNTRGGFYYTWKVTAFASETYPKRFTAELLVREPTPWCNSTYFPVQYAANATFAYSLSITRET